jgi:hypothetical protein
VLLFEKLHRSRSVVATKARARLPKKSYLLELTADETRAAQRMADAQAAAVFDELARTAMPILRRKTEKESVLRIVTHL